MKELTLLATIDSMGTVAQWVEEQLEEFGCPMKAQMQLAVAVDELFSNIARYAYGDGEGEATVRIEKLDRPAIRITFLDRGVPYDPLKNEDPDTTLSVEERKIGGLGIYMVKKSMDAVTYRYQDGQNILVIEKNI